MIIYDNVLSCYLIIEPNAVNKCIYLCSVKNQMAVGYNPDGSVAPLTNLGYVAPAGQMYSTTQDLDIVRVPVTYVYSLTSY